MKIQLTIDQKSTTNRPNILQIATKNPPKMDLGGLLGPLGLSGRLPRVPRARPSRVLERLGASFGRVFGLLGGVLDQFGGDLIRSWSVLRCLGVVLTWGVKAKTQKTSKIIERISKRLRDRLSCDFSLFINKIQRFPKLITKMTRFEKRSAESRKRRRLN